LIFLGVPVEPDVFTFIYGFSLNHFTINFAIAISCEAPFSFSCLANRTISSEVSNSRPLNLNEGCSFIDGSKSDVFITGVSLDWLH
jgi:hypothetical protein